MKKKMSLLLAALLLTAMPAMAQENDKGSTPAPFNCDFAPSCEVAPGIYGGLNAPTTSKFNLSIGGFVKLDYAYNSVNFGSVNAFMTPVQIPKTSSLAGERNQSVFSVRQSRIWFKVNGPTLLGAKTSGLLEFDFNDATGANINLNPSPRLRHAYANLDWGKTQVLFGQTTDIFGLAFGSTVDFRSGASTGYPNTRNPQLRVTHRFDLNKDNAIKAVVGIQTPYQNSDQVTNTNGAPGNAGDTWGDQVNYAGQLLFISKALGVAPGYYGLTQNSLTAGFFGLYGNESIQGQSPKLNNWGVGFYTFVPILRSCDGKTRARTLSFEGQVYEAAGLANPLFATAATTVGTAGNLHAAKGYGIASQLYFYPIQDLGFSGGYGRRNALNYANYSNQNNFETFNELYFINAAYDVNAAIRVAAEYQYRKTQYGNAVSVSGTPAGSSPLFGNSNFGQANIARLSLYYFF